MTEKKRPEHPCEVVEGLENPQRRRVLGSMAAAGAALALGGCAGSSFDAGRGSAQPGAARDAALDAALRRHIRHVVVVYCENRSFDHLFHDFPGLEQPLSAVPPERWLQRDRDGSVLNRLPSIPDGLVPHRQTLDGQSYQMLQGALGGLANRPWALCTPTGAPLPHGLVTSDPIHEFFRHQMQINGGSNDGFVAWTDSGAMPMGHYADTAANLALWRLAREYTLCDNFFMGAFGGSFLAHQYLIAARAPSYPDADRSPAAHRIAALEDGPEGYRLKLEKSSPASAMLGSPEFTNEGALTPDFYAVSDFGPPYSPSFNVDPKNPAFADLSDGSILPPQDYDTIGDRLSAKGVDWAWYGGAWQMALDGKGADGISAHFPESPNFQAHHQPFNYFRRFAPGSLARLQHLRDGGVGHAAPSNRFIADIEAGRLPVVSFYKPQGNLNLHAGSSSIAAGDEQVAHIVAALKASPLWQDTLLVVTVDEYGGWWDHVAPPKADRWGPGSRIPALVISPHAKKGHVEHTVYDTGSIQRFLNRRFGLDALPGIHLRDVSMRRYNGFAPGDLTEALAFD